MSMSILLLSLIIAVLLMSSIVYAPDKGMKGAGFIAGLLVLFLGVAFSSVRFVGADEVGIVKKNALGPNLTGGRIIATGGEMGVQADTLPPGWHLWYWPIIYDVQTRKLIIVDQDQVGLVEARDGEPLDAGQLFAPAATEAEFKLMINDASHFLTSGGRKGPQSNVLRPGKYRVNTELFNVTMVDATEVPSANVAVLKANFGTDPTMAVSAVDGDEPVLLADEGERGVRAQPLPPGKYPINTKAFTVEPVSTKETIVRFTVAEGERRSKTSNDVEQTAITVRTSDGFTFPVDVRIEYRIQPEDAPIVIAKLGNDGEPLIAKLNSTVRAIFRNNAEGVKALDYVNQRSQQEEQSRSMIATEMARIGVTVTAVRIGDVGDESSLGSLLKTQTDREIAVQEQITFQEQQKAAEQRKELTRTEQEAEEERRLATAKYEVDIATEAQKQRIIEAEAEGQAIQIEADAQALAYQKIAEQIGSSNAALIEVLKIVGRDGIMITPRVMVTGGGSGPGSSQETVALIGTMLDRMVSDAETEAASSP